MCSTMSSLQVAVRLRPLNKREKDSPISAKVDHETKTISVCNDKKLLNFGFDFTYSPDDTTQEKVYTDIGKEMLDYSLQGYNICIFAYGQTGSGKSYTMMGDSRCQKEKGIIPRLCEDLFKTIEKNIEETKDSEEKKTYQVEVSYLEIYCERVKDLLRPTDKVLKVREHPKLGPYVDGLAKCAVSSYFGR